MTLSRQLLTFIRYAIVALVVHFTLTIFNSSVPSDQFDIVQTVKKTYIKRIPTDFKNDRFMSVNPWSEPMEVIWYDDPNKNWGIFNPSILPLPSSSPYQYLVGGRFPGYAEDNKELGFGLWKSRIALCFMNLIETKEKRYFKCQTEPKILDFDIPYEQIIERARGKKDEFSWSKFIGAEDPRLGWNEHGLPYLLYGMNSKVKSRHRTVWLTDVRNVFPEVNQIWPKLCMLRKSAPIFKKMELGSTISDDENLIHDLEKNWAPMLTDSGFYLHANLNPRLIFKPLVKNNEIQLDLVKGYDNTTFLKCFSKIFDSPQDKPYHAIHQATNLLRVTKCYVGECEPTSENTFYFQVFNVKNYGKYHYKRYIVVWNSQEPEFKFHSIIGPFELPGLDMDKFHFVVSLQYIPEKEHESSCGHSLDHGYLNSKIVIGVGSEDSKSRAYILTPEQFLSSEKVCSFDDN